MWRWLRRSYLIFMALLPLGMWWGLKAAGIVLSRVRVLGGVSLSVLFVTWSIGWEMAVMAALGEWGDEPLPPKVSWRQEIGMWLLYSAMGVFLGGVFALWVWLMVSTTNFLVWLAPRWLEPMIKRLAPAFGLLWFVVGIFALTGMMESGATDVFRQKVRGILGVWVSDQEILKLLETSPLPEEAKSRYRKRIQAEGVSEKKPQRTCWHF
jgi:hypothetical protein